MEEQALAERWADVPGFEGFYKVSDQGRVLSVERKCLHPKGERCVRERLLKLTPQRSKGKVVSHTVKLCNEGDRQYFSIAHLILLSFERPPKGDEVAHFKDGNPLNTKLTNLEWSTYQQIAFSAVNGGYIPPRFPPTVAKDPT